MKTKSNKNKMGSLLFGHISIVAVLESIDSKFDNPKVTLETIGGVLQETFLPENIPVITKTFLKVSKKFGFAGADFVKKTTKSLKRQDAMGIDQAKTLYRALHNVIMSKISDIFVVDKNASVKIRTLLGLVDVTIVPLNALPLLAELFSYKSMEIGVNHMGWVSGPLSGLQKRITMTTSNGQGEPTSGTYHGGDEIADEVGAHA